MRRQSAQRVERPIRKVAGQGRRGPGKDRRKGQRAAKNPGTAAIPGFALARKEGFELLGMGEMVCNQMRVVLVLQRFPGFGVKCCATLCDG